MFLTSCLTKFAYWGGRTFRRSGQFRSSSTHLNVYIAVGIEGAVDHMQRDIDVGYRVQKVDDKRFLHLQAFLRLSLTFLYRFDTQIHKTRDRGRGGEKTLLLLGVLESELLYGTHLRNNFVHWITQRPFFTSPPILGSALKLICMVPRMALLSFTILLDCNFFHSQTHPKDKTSIVDPKRDPRVFSYFSMAS